MADIIWQILGAITIVLLIFYWRRKNAVWSGFVIGLILGILLSIFNGFDLLVIGKSSIAGAMFGFAARILAKISDPASRQINNTNRF